MYSNRMKLLRLSGRKVCERVKIKGMLWKGKHMHVRYLTGAPRNRPGATGIFAGLVTSSKLHKSAVKRNKVRRRCREAFRVTLKEMALSHSVQLLIFPRSSSLSAPFDELLSDARRFLSSL